MENHERHRFTIINNFHSNGYQIHPHTGTTVRWTQIPFCQATKPKLKICTSAEPMCLPVKVQRFFVVCSKFNTLGGVCVDSGLACELRKTQTIEQVSGAYRDSSSAESHTQQRAHTHKFTYSHTASVHSRISSEMSKKSRANSRRLPVVCRLSPASEFHSDCYGCILTAKDNRSYLTRRNDRSAKKNPPQTQRVGRIVSD